MKYNTIDLDLNSKFLTLNFGYVSPKDFFDSVFVKISKCKFSNIIEIKESARKGFHVKILCNKNCDICRLVFDHQKRYVADLTRREIFSNIMFDDKSG